MKENILFCVSECQKESGFGSKAPKDRANISTDGVRSSRGRTSRRIPGAWKGRRKKFFLSSLLVSVTRKQRHSTCAELAIGWGPMGVQGLLL